MIQAEYNTVKYNTVICDYCGQRTNRWDLTSYNVIFCPDDANQAFNEQLYQDLGPLNA